MDTEDSLMAADAAAAIQAETATLLAGNEDDLYGQVRFLC